MHKNLTLVVLAAGMGSRFGGLKQLDKVGPTGEAIIDYSVYDALRAGFNKVVFVIRKDIENDFRTFVGNKFEGKIEVEYVFQELDKLPEGIKPFANRQKPWGTGHAVLMAAEVVKDNFAVINADDFYGREAFLTLANHLLTLDTDSYDNAMVGYLLKNTLSEHGYVSRGQCTSDAKHCLIDVVERTHIEREQNGIFFVDENSKKQKLDNNTLVSMNFWGFTPKFFEQLEKQFRDFLEDNIQEAKAEFYIPTVVNSMIKSGLAKTKVLQSDANWFGVTYREDKPVVVQKIADLVENNIYPLSLWE